ncbi:peptidase associated/transthyretin-like domain-containing protein [Coprobacter fastidiosus]
MKSFIQICFLSALIFLLSGVDIIAQNLRVAGVVRGNNEERLAGVTIINKETEKVVGLTDEDGKYSVVVPVNGILNFTCLGYDRQDIKVKGRQIIDVVLVSTAVKIQEVSVVAKIKNKVIFEPSEIEVVGNYFHLRTRFKVPAEMFSSNTRLIVQPTLYNITRKKGVLLKPVVTDGREYTLTQERMYEFDLKNDPLEPYIRKSEMTKNGELVVYHDSAYIENLKEDFRADIRLSLENYNRILFTDSFQIARGLVNPLRFFEYKLTAKDITDERYFPKPELQLRNDRGEVELSFLPGKADINDRDPKNASELAKLRERLSSIETNPDAKLQTFSILGVSSPEGPHDKNLVLAKKRMDLAVNRILSHLNKETLDFLKIQTGSKVETWQTAIEMMRRDSLFGQAQDLQNIVNKYPDSPDKQWRAIIRLPYYRSVIVPHYLPLMRRVEYNFDYSIYRFLTDAEIKELYLKDYKQLSRHEFWRMFEIAESDEEKETIYKQALEVYPKFMLAANNLSALYINQGRPDDSILESFISKDAPEEVLTNQAVALLSNWKYEKADSVVSLIPDGVSSEYLKSVTRALNGNYEEALATFGQEGGINEVVLLLALKRNDEAWEKAQNLPETARSEYVKAIAANRLDKVMDAINHIEKAFELDPSLRDVAKVDADVMDLL